MAEMKRSLLAVAAALSARQAAAQFAQAAMMRFQCSQLVIERLDPLVNPGMEQSTHLHQIVGGNSFNATMTPVEHDPPTLSTCTTCSFSEDFSNYWTANVYFRAKNGSFKRVPQMVNLGLRGEGGVTVYYIPPYDGKTKVTAFKPVSPQYPIHPLDTADRLRVSACWLATPIFGKGGACRGRSAIAVNTTSSRPPSAALHAQVMTLPPFRTASVPAAFARQSPSRRQWSSFVENKSGR